MTRLSNARRGFPRKPSNCTWDVNPAFGSNTSMQRWTITATSF